jgi:MHS family proline/betaine transporter-like MFS transporter
VPAQDSGDRPAVADDTAAGESRMRRRVVLASVLGNGLEWFDFVSYGYFASIIAKVFFPADSNLSLVLTYATFAVGFVVRPIGGIILGAYADRYGRRRALSLLIVMMAFGTLTLGLTPPSPPSASPRRLSSCSGGWCREFRSAANSPVLPRCWWSTRRRTGG